MSDSGNRGDRYTLSHPPIPHLIGKSHDGLANSTRPEKQKDICCITSATTLFRGHVKRLELLQELRRHFDVDIFGRGISTVKSKWDVYAKYKYAIVLENSEAPYYWSEKISDCFLAWTMPLYIGTPRIGEYFPEKSIVTLDSNSPERAIQQIREAIGSGRYEQNIGALCEARRRVLFEYGFFPYIASLIEKHEAVKDAREVPEWVTIRSVTPNILESWARAKIAAARANSPWRKRVSEILSPQHPIGR